MADKITAIYGGGFKPPHKGHFKVAEQTLSQFPEINTFKIFVGGGIRDNFTQEDSIKIWEIYKKYLPQSSKIQIESSSSPIGDIKKYAKEHPEEEIYFILGAREGKEEDFKDIESRTKNTTEKYPNLKIKIIFTSDVEISGTNARKAIENYKEFFKYLPDDLSENDKEQVFNITKMRSLEENTTYSNFIDYKQYIKDLTKHMLELGENILPLPKVIFKHSDISNAKNFFGKTGYYNPDTMEIILYTEGRHPKDIVRSFSHEMVHHVQNLENRLKNITTTNTNEDSDLENLEKEAYLNGNISFRKWTDSINEVGEGTAGIYDWNEKSQDDNLVFVEFKTDQDTIYSIQLLYLKNSEALDIEFVVKNEKGNWSFRTITNKGELYKVMATITDIIKYYLKKFEDVNTIRYSPSKKSGEDNSQRDLLYRAFISKLIPNIKFRQRDDVILATTGDFTPFSKYLNENFKDYFGLNKIIKELIPELEKPSFSIYCDMDGVLCDFDKRVEELFNKSPKEIPREELIELVNNKGVEFWSKMGWIEGGQELWNKISKYNPSLLTSPGSFKYAPEGKKIWAQENLSPTPKDIMFRPVRDKYTVLNGKSEKEIKNSILIDDYSPNIFPWKQEGGIGILHKSFEKTESILNKFNL